MLAQVMSSTMPVTAKSRSRGSRASSWNVLCPWRALSSVSSMATNWAMVCSLPKLWSGASTSWRMGRYTRLMAASACSLPTPRSSRAKRYAQ
jgi:hypothetical protein